MKRILFGGRVILAASIFVSSIYCMASRKTVVVDLCVKPNAAAGASELGWWNIAKYTMSGFNPRKLQNELLLKLESMPAMSDSQGELGYYQGKKVPPIMQDYITGDDPSCETKDAVEQFLDSWGEPAIFKAAAALIFSPKSVVNVLEPDPFMVKYLRDMYAQDPKASYILAANWNASVFKALCESGKFDDYLAYFKADDGSLRAHISGKVKLAKPHPGFYESLINNDTYHIDLKRTTIIESEKEHAKAAKKAGFADVLYYHQTETDDLPAGMYEYQLKPDGSAALLEKK